MVAGTFVVKGRLAGNCPVMTTFKQEKMKPTPSEVLNGSRGAKSSIGSGTTLKRNHTKSVGTSEDVREFAQAILPPS